MAEVSPEVQFGVLAAAVGLAMAMSYGWAQLRGHGIVHGDEPDQRLLRAAAESLGLAFLAGQQQCTISGRYRGVNVIVEAKWWRTGRNRRGFGSRDTWAVQTTARAAFGTKMPAGMHLRRQSTVGKFADALINGDEIVVDDAHFDEAYLIHGDDVAAIGQVLQPAARTALLRLADQGDVWVDEASVRLVVPKYVSSLIQVSRLLDAVVAAVHEMRGPDAPAGADEVPLPVAMRPLRLSLAALIRKAVAAGFNLTETGRSALAAIPGTPCMADVDVQRAEPWRSPRTGREDGLAIDGSLVSGTGHVTLHLPAAQVAMLGGPVVRGDRLRVEAIVQSYDAMRDIADLECDGAASRVTDGPPSTISMVRPAAYDQADQALAEGTPEALLSALYLGREAREYLLPKVHGRRFALQGVLADVAPTAALRVTDDRLRGGLTVALRHPAVERPLFVRFPHTRNPWLEQQSIGAEVEVDAELVGWDEIGEAAVFVEVG